MGDQHETSTDLAIQFKHQCIDLRGVFLVKITGRLIAEYKRARQDGR